MRVMAQVCMVMNLDKCIGCHTCTVTCKQTWTNRPGTEYVYFNNVETKPGLGYPARYEDQEQWKGGWELDRKGRLRLRGGSRLKRLASIFYNPDLPTIDDYHDPFTYDYARLITAPAGTKAPEVSARSALTGREMVPKWGTNWEDDLAGAPEPRPRRPEHRGHGREGAPRLRVGVHVLPAPHLRALPQPLVRRVAARRGRCTSGRRTASCWSTRTAAGAGGFACRAVPTRRCTSTTAPARPRSARLCFPRIEAGPAHHLLGDLRRAPALPRASSSTTPTPSPPQPPRPDPEDLYEAQLSVFLDPDDPAVAAEAEAQGIPHDWVAGGAPLARLRADRPPPRRPAAAPRVPDHAHGLVHPAAVPGGRRHRRGRLRRGEPRRHLRRH